MIVSQIVQSTIEQIGLIPFITWVVTGLIMQAACIWMISQKIKIFKWNYYIVSVFFIYSTLLALAILFFVVVIARISVWFVAEERILSKEVYDRES
jgi:hypothetical protein